MQGRIEQTDGDWPPSHGPEQAHKILTLHRQQFLQRGAALHAVNGQDHLTHIIDATAFKKHVFGAAQAYALSAIGDCRLRHRWGVSVGADTQRAVFV